MKNLGNKIKKTILGIFLTGIFSYTIYQSYILQKDANSFEKGLKELKAIYQKIKYFKEETSENNFECFNDKINELYQKADSIENSFSEDYKIRAKYSRGIILGE